MTNTFSPSFIDKADVNVPKTHRFHQLFVQLQAYQGVDILPYTDDNDLLTGLVREQAIKHYDNLLQNKSPVQACVLVLITDEPNPKLLLTRRSSHLNSHAGEVSLVGGKRDECDATSVDVALREAYEEIGLDKKYVQILGYLPMQISKKGLLVRPVVASIAPEAVKTLIANADEIDRVFWLPLQVLHTQPIDFVFDRSSSTTSATKLHTPAWLYDSDGDGKAEVIWGLTGRILASLMQIGFGRTYAWYYRLSTD